MKTKKYGYLIISQNIFLFINTVPQEGKSCNINNFDIKEQIPATYNNPQVFLPEQLILGLSS